MKALNILIVDDEAIIRLDLKELLTDAGHNVVGEAENGEVALLKARELKPDLILMDVKMPVMDGLAAAKLINEEQIAPVVLLTAYSQEDIVAKAAESGVFGYIVKPVREEQIFPAIEIAMSKFGEAKMLEDEIGNLKESLETRKLLDRAKGVLMTAHGMNEQEAYRRMQQYSMNRRLSIKEVAEAIIAAVDKK